ncbi:phosphatidyl serine synthase-domain-containing protein [Lanmaoa asiatica]|nr:phosphatidyl serine synthase-domain-containing protein [Lanmaoa asiatica]
MILEPEYESPTSPHEASDVLLSPSEVEPKPGLDGAPVRYRTEPYTRIAPFQERSDTSVEFFYKPITLTALSAGLAALAYIAMSPDVLVEGRDKRRVGVYAAIASFLMFSMIQFRDGPFIRPHPAFWRVVLGINLLYELALVFLLFQDLHSARRMMTFLDPALNVPLPEKNYAEDCALTAQNVWSAIDIFCLAHALGWFGKAMVLRDYWFCWVCHPYLQSLENGWLISSCKILSIAFEFAEYSLQHQLPNFAECWWDHWILDVLLCNWIGTYLGGFLLFRTPLLANGLMGYDPTVLIGMKTCQYLEVKPYEWRGLRQTRGLRSKAKRVLSQFSPHDWTAFKWEGTTSFRHYVTVVLLLAVFLAAELNPFYLKSLLWMEPDHPIIIMRLAFVFLCALPAVRELYQYINNPKYVPQVYEGRVSRGSLYGQKSKAHGAALLAAARHGVDRAIGNYQMEPRNVPGDPTSPCAMWLDHRGDTFNTLSDSSGKLLFLVVV